MATQDYTDISHTGPETLAGRYLRRFWQPVYRAQDLPAGRAMPIQIMGEAFTLYRGESGTPYLVDSACGHRGTQLSVGWVEQDCIRCRYHGWMFDGHGQCVEQPLEDVSFASRVRISSYPVQEYLGLIFAYLGEGEPPPIKRFPDFERQGYLEAGPPEYWPCNFMTRIDNDSRHIIYTHRESWIRMGVNRKPGPTNLQSEETEYGVRTFGPPEPGRPQHYTHFHMPNINQVKTPRIEGTIEDAQNLEADRLFWRVPIDDDNCVNFVVDYLPLSEAQAAAYRERRSAAGEANPAELNALGELILAGKLRIEDLPADMSIYKLFWIEDYVTQLGQRYAQQHGRPERLGRTDVGVVLKRAVWQRELKALAEGRPLTQWTSPPEGLAVLADPMPALAGRD
jgi:5,5'-dehydrodivanillate O-demethylase